MNIVQKYNIIRAIQKSNISPTILHEAYEDSYTLRTNEYNIRVFISHPSYDGESLRPQLTVTAAQLDGGAIQEINTLFARIVSHIMARKYYKSNKTK